MQRPPGCRVVLAYAVPVGRSAADFVVECDNSGGARSFHSLELVQAEAGRVRDHNMSSQLLNQPFALAVVILYKSHLIVELSFCTLVGRELEPMGVESELVFLASHVAHDNRNRYHGPLVGDLCAFQMSVKADTYVGS